MASEYSSQLVVFDQGREVMRKRIEVNDPLKYKGYTFYQSSYGMMDDKQDFIFMLNVRNASGASERHDLRLGDAVTIPGTSMKLTLTDFSPALRFDPSGRPSTYGDMMTNPGLQLRVGEGEGSYMKWLLKRYPQSWNLAGGHRLELIDVWGAQFTGIQVRRDPGVWIVYLGCLIMSVGLYFAFFTSHRRLWVMVTDGGKSGARVLVAGTAHKGREGFERSIDRMITLLTEGGK
jgi:cytochrome c biogenesis protein